MKKSVCRRVGSEGHYFFEPETDCFRYYLIRQLNVLNSDVAVGYILPLILIDFIRGLAYNIKEVLILVLHIVERFNMEYLSIKQTSDKWGMR